MLRIETYTVQQNVTLRCYGRIVLGLEAEALRCMATARPEPCLVLDLSDVEAIDAAGLGLLVELHCWAQQRNKLMKVLNPSECVRRLVALTSLHTVLEIVHSDTLQLVDGSARSRGTDGERRAMTA